MEIVIIEHALRQAARRGIAEDEIREVAARPEQVISVREGREIRQSRITLARSGKTVIIRAVVDVSSARTEVVTVNLTTKIAKYWREP